MAKDDHAPWKPAKYTDSDVVAIQALASGEANADQQKRALKWIVEDCCKTYDMSYRPNNTGDTTFAEGKRHVGNEIIKMIKLKLGNLQKISKVS